VLGYPDTLIVRRVFKTGETLLGVIDTTLVGSVPTVTLWLLSVTPLTVTVREGVVEVNLLVIHLIRVEEMDTTLQIEPSEKVTE